MTRGLMNPLGNQMMAWCKTQAILSPNKKATGSKRTRGQFNICEKTGFDQI